MLTGVQRGSKFSQRNTQCLTRTFPDCERSAVILYATSISMRTLFLLHKKGTRISQYLTSRVLRARGQSSSGKIRAFPRSSGPVILPRIVQGASSTRELFRMRFTFPAFGLLKTYSLPPFSPNHTGVVTGTPFLRKDVREMYLCPCSGCAVPVSILGL